MRTIHFRYISSIIVLSFITTIQNAWCQDQKVADSLRPIYENENLDPLEKMDILHTMAGNEITDIQQSILYSEELIKLADEQQNARFLFLGYYQKAAALRVLGDLRESLKLFFTCADMVTTHKLEGKLENTYIAIADVYSEMGNSDNAITYYNKAVELFKTTNNQLGIATTLLNAGDEYLNIDGYDQALINFTEATTLFEELGHNVGQAYAMGNMGMALVKKGQPEKALNFIQEAIVVLEEVQDYYAISEYLTYLADIHLQKDDWTAAAKYSNRSLELAEKYGLKKQISESNLQLSELNEKAGNYDLAYGYLKNHIVYRDSIQNIENVKAMANMRTDFEVSQKQTEVDLLNEQKQNQRLVLFGSILALLTISIIAFGLFRKNKFINTTNEIIANEKNKTDRLLLNILPEETAKELKENGRVKARKFESVTVMFSDFKNFTLHSEHLSPEDVVESIDFYFSKFDEIMEKHGLEKIKTIGDAYMCASGLPFETEKHAHQMVRAAMEMVQFVDDIKLDNENNKTRFDIRIGISTGPVVAGVVGSKKFAYDIWGDTVNVASRMESYSDVSQINISETTYDLIKDEFECEERGEIEVKNKGMMRMYYVKWSRETPIKTLKIKHKVNSLT